MVLLYELYDFTLFILEVVSLLYHINTEKMNRKKVKI